MNTLYFLLEKKLKPQSWNKAETEEFNSSHDKPTSDWGVSFKKDDNGYYCHTHRARSKSKPSPSKITKKELEFIESTG
jgi:hypothetical protein